MPGYKSKHRGSTINGGLLMNIQKGLNRTQASGATELICVSLTQWLVFFIRGKP